MLIGLYRRKTKFFTLVSTSVVIFAVVLGFLFIKSLERHPYAFGQTSDATPYGLDLLQNPEKIAYLRPLVKIGKVSSHAKDGYNKDLGISDDNGQETYLYKNGSNYVLLDEKGPGTITRLWFYLFPDGVSPDGTVFSNYKSYRLKFFFDGETTPRVDKTLDEIFSGTQSPFLSPLVGNANTSSGGSYSYVPMSFAKSVRVEITGMPYYYQIDYEKYDLTVPVTTFTPSIDVSAVVNKWSNAGTQDPKSLSGTVMTTSGTIDSNNPLKKGDTLQIFNQTGSAVIKSIVFTVPGYSDPSDSTSRDVFMNMRIKGTWDNNSQPNIDVPFGSFFGTFLGKTNTKGLFFGCDPQTGRLYNYYPMYFANSANLSLVNNSQSDISGISYQIEYIPLTSIDGLGTKIGYFNATYNQEIPVTPSVDFKMANLSGRGQIVANTLYIKCWSLDQPTWQLHHSCLEGDERFYIDDSKSPDTYGTGTEEFFNGANYFILGPFNRPTHGDNYQFTKYNSSPTTFDGYGEDSAWRIFAVDPIPFRSNILMGIEHGNPYKYGTIELPGWNQKSTYPGNYYSTVFWYGTNAADLNPVDSLDVGNSQSQTSHLYSAGASANIPSQTFFYEGDNDEVPVSDDGQSGTGKITFKMNVDSGKAHVLRRRFDQSIRNQSAEVRIDGVRIGTWYDAGRNSVLRWKESEMFIPAIHTQGKSQITVQVTPNPGSTWTTFRYDLFSIPSTSPQNLSDFDLDGFSDTLETYLGTNSQSDCSLNSSTDAWPPDFNRDGKVSVADIDAVKQAYGKNSSSADWSTKYKRLDLVQNGSITIADIMAVVNLYNRSYC